MNTPQVPVQPTSDGWIQDGSEQQTLLPLGTDDWSGHPSKSRKQASRARRVAAWAAMMLVAVVLAFVAGIGLGTAGQAPELDAADATIEELRAQLADVEADNDSLTEQVADAEDARDDAEAAAVEASQAAEDAEATADKRAAQLDRREKELDRRETGLDQRAANESAPDTTGGVSGLRAGSWTVLGSVVPTDDGYGSFEARFRVRNDGSQAESAMFTMTLLKNGAILATLDCTGAAYEVSVGHETTVDCFSIDDFSTGWTDILLEEMF